MRFTALIAALVLAGVAWIACWQEVQLVRLKRQIKNRTEAAPVVTRPRVKLAAYHPPARTALSQLDELRELLIEREEAIADARDAAGDYGIAEGSPDMDRAILQATQDLDRAIVKLAGPAAATQVTMDIPTAPVPANVQVAPVPQVILIGSAPAQTTAPTTNVYVNVAAPEPSYAYPPETEADSGSGAYAAQPLIYGGIGASIGKPTRRSARRGVSSIQAVKYFAASAGIPLSSSPLGSMVATSPLLLSQQRSASAATGR